MGGNSFLVRLEAMGKEPLDLERNENFLAESSELDAAQPNLVDAQEIQAFLDKNRGSLVEESLTYQTLKSVIASKLSFSSTFHTSHNLTPSSTFATLDPDFAKSYLSQLMTLRLPFSPIDLTHLLSVYSANTLLSFTKKKSSLSLPTLSQHLHLDPTLTPINSKNFYQFTVNHDQKLIQKKCLTIYENTAKLMEVCNGILNERGQLLEWAGMNKLFQVKCKLDAYGIDIEGSNVGLYNFYSGVDWMHKLCGFLGKGDGGILVGYEDAVGVGGGDEVGFGGLEFLEEEPLLVEAEGGGDQVEGFDSGQEYDPFGVSAADARPAPAQKPKKGKYSYNYKASLQNLLDLKPRILGELNPKQLTKLYAGYKSSHFFFDIH